MTKDYQILFNKRLCVLLMTYSLLCCQSVLASSAKVDVTNFRHQIEYFTENLPPYNMSNIFDQPTGYNTDVVVEMLKIVNPELSVDDIYVVPWARAYSRVLQPSSYAALYSMVRTKEREKFFKWVGPLTKSRNSLIVLKGNPKHVKKTPSGKFLPFYRYGAVYDDIGASLLQSDEIPQSSITFSFGFKKLLKLLQIGQIDCISYNPTVAKWLIKGYGLNKETFAIIEEQEVGEHYIAFNLNIPDEVITKHQEALNSIKQNKEFMDKLQKRWGESIDW